MKKIEAHRKNLLKQIHDKEQERILEKKRFFQESVKLKQDELARQKMLRETMYNKIEELKYVPIYVCRITLPRIIPRGEVTFHFRK